VLLSPTSLDQEFGAPDGNCALQALSLDAAGTA